MIAAIALFVFSAIKILREYERGVIFLLGRFWKVKGPGLIIVIPGIQKMIRVDLRTIVMDVPTQDVISRDNVSVKVSAVIYFRVLDPEKAIIQVENRVEATSQLAQTTLRSVLGRHELDDMLAERDKLNADVQEILDQNTEAWGIKVTNVEIKHVDLDESMIRRHRRAGGSRTGQTGEDHPRRRRIPGIAEAREAASVLSSESQALQLRYLQTLTEISSERNTNTIVFPLPMDLVKPIFDQLQRPE